MKVTTVSEAYCASSMVEAIDEDEWCLNIIPESCQCTVIWHNLTTYLNRQGHFTKPVTRLPENISHGFIEMMFNGVSATYWAGDMAGIIGRIMRNRIFGPRYSVVSTTELNSTAGHTRFWAIKQTHMERGRIRLYGDFQIMVRCYIYDRFYALSWTDRSQLANQAQTQPLDLVSSYYQDKGYHWFRDILSIKYGYNNILGRTMR